MLTTIRGRTIAILSLLALLGGLCVWYGALAPAPALGDHPDEDQLATDADRYLGAQVTVSGRVVATDPVTIRAEVGADETMHLTITDLASTPTVGAQFRVYGIVEDHRTVRARNAVAVPRWGHWYTWSVSFLAGLWVLARILRHWRLDPTDWTLQPRETPWTPPLYNRLQTYLRHVRD